MVIIWSLRIYMLYEARYHVFTPETPKLYNRISGALMQLTNRVKCCDTASQFHFVHADGVVRRDGVAGFRFLFYICIRLLLLLFAY